MRQNAIKALLIDLDGTLVDSAPDLTAAMNRLLGELGRPALSVAAVTAMIGDGMAKLVERGVTASGLSPSVDEWEGLAARFMAHYEAALVVETQVYPGVVETLQTLKRDGLRLGLCTNKPERASRRILDAFGLTALFEVVAGGDSFPVRKPHGDHPRGILERLGVEPRDAVMLGDSRNDLLAGRNAGLPVVLVSYGYCQEPVRGLGAEGVIDRFTDLPATLEKIR